jgi:hypothetical protein
MGLVWDDWQKAFLDTEGDKILCTGRQVGKSEVCAADAARWAIKQQAPANCVMIAPTERQAYGLFEKTLNYLMAHYPHKIKQGRDKPTKEKITLLNGVRIYCLPVGISGLGIRFLTISRLYVDEASRVPEDVWNAITPSLLTTGGAKIFLSTPFGAQGTFYNCWVNKDGAYNSFARFSITSEDVIRKRKISEVWTDERRNKAIIHIEQEKARMSRRQFAQEYLGEFLQDLNQYFSDELIKKCCVLRKEERNVNKIHFLGVDIARMGDDECTFEILSVAPGEVIKHVENIITKKKFTTETETKILELNRIWNFKEIGIDAGSGSLGVGIYDHLLTTEIKRKVVAINNRERAYDRDETSKTKLLKEDLYDNLRALMERGEILLLNTPEVIESLKSVQYEYIVTAGKRSRIRIFGDYTHVVEGIIRAAWLASHKRLNIWFK